jgi:ribosomal protein L29
MAKKETFKDKKFEEIIKIIKDLERELFDLRVDNVQRKLKNGHSINQKRKEIARAKTALRNLELKNAR